MGDTEKLLALTLLQDAINKLIHGKSLTQEADEVFAAYRLAVNVRTALINQKYEFIGDTLFIPTKQYEECGEEAAKLLREEGFNVSYRGNGPLEYRSFGFRFRVIEE